MNGLSNDLRKRCISTFQRCSQFDSDDHLKAFLGNAGLDSFQNKLPEAKSKSECVEKCLDFLRKQRLDDGQAVLPLFLAELRDRYYSNDELHKELDDLEKKARIEYDKLNPNLELETSVFEPPVIEKRRHLILAGAIVLSLAIVLGILPSLFKQFRPTPTVVAAKAFNYQVKVIAQDTEKPVQNARVMINVSDQSSLNTLTDDNGIAQIFVSSNYIGLWGQLCVVEAEGYNQYVHDVHLIVNAVPNIVQLEPKLSTLGSSSPIFSVQPTATALPEASHVVWDYRGASMAGYWRYAYAPQGNVYEIIDQLQAAGVNAITVLATWYQDGFTTSQIERGPMTPRDEDVIALIQYAHQRGMRVVLKPHVDPLNGWRGDIAPDNASEWFGYFTANFLLHYARMAQEQQVEMLVIGTEYDKLVAFPYVNHWADAIAAVRQVYQGKVTYAATEPSLFSGNIPDWFWQSLDMVGVTFYHDFSHARTPGVAEVVQAWQDHHVVADLQAFHQKFGVPVLLAEVGYRSIDYAGIDTWRTEGPNGGTDLNPEQSIAYNGQGQANLYEGLLRALGNQPWVAGIFMWQYVPDGGCTTALRGGIGNTDYSVLGKPAALTVHNWFGGPTTAPAQWNADTDNPLVHTFEFSSPEYVEYSWQVATSGSVSFTVDLEHHPPMDSSAQSLLIDAHVPIEGGRFQQMDYYFCDGARDWRGYKSIELWVRADIISDEPEGCELAIGLIDGRSQEREFWQSSQWLKHAVYGTDSSHWRKVQISLTDAITTENDPWRHPTDFVIPKWEKPVNGVLDLSAVLGVRIKTLTTSENPAYPDCRVWLGPMQVSIQAVEIIPSLDLPIIDAFEYQRATTIARVWKAPGTLPGTVTWTPDTQRHAPTGSTRSWHVHTPCASPRFEQVTNFMLGGGVDLSGYVTLELWAGGDLINTQPHSSEFSIILEDKDGEQWQSVRWLGRTIQGAEYAAYGLEPVRISLTSFVTAAGASPWHHPVDFALINEVTGGNKHLDRDWIKSITLKTLTTDEYCAQYPDYDVWIDLLVASTVPVTPPELINPPTIDHFEYGDKETARIIWKWVSSGQINVTMDTNVHASGSSRSMRISSDIPAGSARYGQVFNTFIPGAQDLSAYSSLHFWARTDNVAPWGGELSIELVETDPISHVQEVWRNTRRFRSISGEWITINLVAGANVQADPWDPTYQNSFVVPVSGSFVDGVLDLTHITEIRIISQTTNENASSGYTHLDLWIDEMTVQ